MIIERLQRADLALYKQLIDKCFDGSNDIKEYQKYNDAKDAPYEILVAKEDDIIVGALTFYKMELFTFSFQPTLEIFNVAVLKEYRGQKIAKSLMLRTIEYAKANGYNSINLTCLDYATDAHRLYESVGMVRTGSFKYNLPL